MSTVLKFLLLCLLGGSFCSATEVESLVTPNGHLHLTAPSKEQPEAIDKMAEIKGFIKKGVTVNGEVCTISVNEEALKAATRNEMLQTDLLERISQIQSKSNISDDIEGYVFYLFRGELCVEGTVKESSLFG